MNRSFFTRLLPALAVGLLLALSGNAQTPSSVVSTDQGCVAFIICGSIINPADAYDGNTNTWAEINAPLALGTARMRLGYSGTVAAGARTRLTVSATGGDLLDVSALSQIAIRTYNTNSSQPTVATNSLTLSNLITIGSLGPNITQVDFTAAGDFNQLEVSVGGVVNLSRSIRIYEVGPAPAAPLPVKLVSFIGKPTGKTTELTWRTASEENNDYFLIERATSAQQEYRAIGRVTGHGTSSQTYDYSFVDTQPLSVGYYRLRQVDTDGTSTFSPVVVVRQQASELAWSMYPNPVAESLTVTGPAGSRYEILNQLGQRVSGGTMPLAQAQRLDVQNLPDGAYFLRDASTGDTYRILKNSAALQQR